MSNFIDYYEYSKLADATYVDLYGLSGDGKGTQLASAVGASGENRLPTTLADETFVTSITNKNTWKVLDDSANLNDSAGFSATLFNGPNPTTGKDQIVLAIRGTEPTTDGTNDLVDADIGQIGVLGLAMSQTVSMINYILRLEAQNHFNDGYFSIPVGILLCSF